GVTATAANNSLARIVHIVEAEQVRKGASQRLADCIARPLVPRVSSAAPPLMSTPSLEAAPMDATTVTGTAMASAHGAAAT
ncbi:hypothetical protein, partial [Mycobacterium tuberculosis]|uniref:hypothetical protein n=1 Tax=Mycobacterium tuberculosis TaxID=1773 RepID=UPI001BDF737B